ncbi:hypothetical protein [Micromonospora musae]|uniref:hypothetical protein n=1 Tax=Micromonospora musae TaxID=1894970 RepID=UPI00267DD47F|nr:hypothetical protein [Micromonospora musae]
MRLFDEGEPSIQLALLTSQAFSTGVLNLVYAPSAPTAPAGYEEAKRQLARARQGSAH